MYAKYAAITFDDGDKTLYDIVPILTSYNLPATFFLNTAYLNNESYGYQIIKYLLHAEDGMVVPEFLLKNVNNIRNTLNRIEYKHFREIFRNFLKEFQPNLDLYINESFIEKLDQSLFHIGLHGHTHERYSMMNEEWQKLDLIKNIEILSSYNNYRPFFAIPYGKSIDWNMNTIKIALNLDCEVLYHDSINLFYRVGINRIPADHLTIEELMIKNLEDKILAIKISKHTLKIFKEYFHSYKNS
ncbi:MAG: polysaccharide deacetylase family protein [Ignavibacteriales bacterium]|nr:polysaccharide deacetylase family protein [Ignavibacteriales bacterium]